ncbi:beta-1,3-glucanase 5 [Arabidopsis thaliana]|uniref:Probable glucan endo-1,3-beta-glucosidase BG5 n=1 Tax=Arabidopsis thaliana TaxID=3702 RepID=BG5_ARATH|nr:beta-1,3-glucanase 5 [Arabidopsis thaliana]O49353.1 RecName: Full=Probable glucan endo-1,3-beta-glucosidase BG5; AltName: Full=Beta-1,3-glucanase 5; Flags: Precursor [Arabidopsis thaliana]AED92833.1 beta-1,3-glucanase 5 [Arabidopsis thaliana]CAA56135.1 bg5 [Arabidopsis thaliana]|eukprot:NP_197534.1 beta-1,3-glucanase 5 [Arabidopsis thaliana]
MLYLPKKLFLFFFSCIVVIVNYNNSDFVNAANSIGFVNAANSIGLNYGLLGDNLPSPSKVITLYKSIDITKIRIFDPNTEVLNALRGHRDIAVTVGVRDQDLAALSASEEAVKGWFATNIEPYLSDINIAFITVGNEVIPGPIGPQVLPVMQSLTNLVKSRNLPISISTVVAMWNLEQSYPPSAGMFTSQAREQLVPVLKLLSQTNSPILVKIYPYFSYASDPSSIRLDYATFNTEAIVVQDGSLGYSNMFDAIFDAFVWAMEKEGVKDLPMVVSETGWPSAGNGNITTPDIAGTYNRNFVKHIASGKGTPKRPNKGIDGFLFATFNENQKPVGTEQNFGLYNPNDMKPIYNLF